MIIGIGTDIVDIKRIEKAIEKEAFVKKVFVGNESERALKNKETAAGIYAAKEAFVKAVGTGFRKITIGDIEVKKDDLGKPYFAFLNEALKFVEYNNATVHLTISHEREYAVAFVIIEGRG